MARTPSPPASPASSFQWSSEEEAQEAQEAHEVQESRQREPPHEAPRKSDVRSRRQSRRNASPNTVPVSRSSQARNSAITRRIATRGFEDEDNDDEEEEEEYAVSRSPSPGAQLFGELQAAMKPRANMKKSRRSIPRPKARQQEKMVVFTSDEEEGPVEAGVGEGYARDEHSRMHHPESRSSGWNNVVEDFSPYPEYEEQVRPAKQSAPAIFTSDEESVHKKASPPAKTQTKRQSIAKRQSLAKSQSKSKNTNKIVIFTSDDDSDAAPARKSPTPSPQPPPRRKPQPEPTPRKKGEYVLSSDSSGSGDEEYLSANETKNNKTVFVSTDKESSRRRGIAVSKKAAVNAHGWAEKTPTAKKDRARDVHLADLMGRASISGPGIREGYYQSEDEEEEEEEEVERVPIQKSHKPLHGGFVISEAEVSDIDGEASEDEEEEDSTGSMDDFIDDGSQAEEDSEPESEDDDEELYEEDSLDSLIDSQAEEDSEPESGDQGSGSDINELEKALKEYPRLVNSQNMRGDEPKTPGRKKKLATIPTPPYRHDSQEFWDQEATNLWNDTHSPRKKLPAVTKQPAIIVISSDEEEVPASRIKRRSQDSDGSEDEEDEEEDDSEYNSLDDFIEYDDDPRTQHKTPKTPKRSSRRDTLPSLTPAQQKAQKRDFNAKKVALSENFIRQLDQELTNNAVEAYYAPHGGIKVQWSSRLRTTAGRAKLVKGTIELSDKVITDEHRLYNVVAHEFCHLAVWSISNERHEHHGSEFKRWGAKAIAAFPEYDLDVTRCHNYKIEYKFQFDCVTNMCTYTWQQHSKPKDLDRKRCPWCKVGTLVQTRPTPRGVGKGPTEYQTFTKENMSRIKQQNAGVSHKEIMRILGEEWKKHKAQTPMKAQGRRISIIELDADETIIDDMIGEMKI